MPAKGASSSSSSVWLLLSVWHFCFVFWQFLLRLTAQTTSLQITCLFLSESISKTTFTTHIALVTFAKLHEMNSILMHESPEEADGKRQRGKQSVMSNISNINFTVFPLFHNTNFYSTQFSTDNKLNYVLLFVAWDLRWLGVRERGTLRIIIY